MGKYEKHHLSQQKIQKLLFGEVIDETTVELPKRYHRGVINSLQKKGVSDAYLAGKIDYDYATGEIFDYDNEDFED